MTYVFETEESKAHLINFVNHDGHQVEKFVKTDDPILVLIKFPHDVTELLFGRVLAQSSHHHTHLFDVNDAILVLVKNAEHLPEPKDSFLFHWKKDIFKNCDKIQAYITYF